MDAYKKLLEYKEMLEDGIISEAEFGELKDILYSQKMSELGIRDRAAFEESLKKDAFAEAKLMLNNKTAASYREAIALLETLGDWGDAASVAEQCRSELPALEEQEEKGGLKKPDEHSFPKGQLLQANTYTTDLPEVARLSGGDNNPTTANAGSAAQKVSEFTKGLKITKKKAIIIAVAVLVVGIIIAGLRPKIDHYSMTYTTAKAYSGNSTSNLESDMKLYAVYDNGEEKELNKNSWNITDPSTLRAPETQITINYKGSNLYFDLPVSY